MTKHLLTICLLICAQFAFAHNGSIRGIVYENGSHRPLEGVSIYIKRGDKSAVTDAFGKFFLRNVEPGKVKLQLSHLGYDLIEDDVKVEDGVTTDLTYSMIKGAVQMAAVSVNAKRELNFNSISGLDLKQRPVNSTQDMMRLVPGLFIAQHQGGGKAEQVFLRGFDCDHGTDVNISVDNMPVNMVSHAHGQGFADAHFIIPESVQGVEFGKGPYQVDKGNMNTAGYVAFKTRNDIDNSFVKVDGGSFGYFRTVAGLQLFNRNASANGHQDAYVMGEYGYNRSYFEQSQNFNKFNLMGKYTNYIGADKILSLTLSGFHSSWNASGQIPTRAIAENIVGEYGGIDPEGGVTGRYNMNLQYFQSINSNSYFKSNVYVTSYNFKLFSNFTYFLQDTINGDQIKQAENRVLAGYNSEYASEYNLGGIKAKSVAGIGVRYDDIKGDELTHTVGKTVVLNPIELGDIHETNLSAYFSQSFFVLPQLVVNVGSRYDYFIQQYDNRLIADKPMSTFSGGRISPKMGLCYTFSDKARLYYSYGTGFHTNDTRTLALGRQLGSDVTINHAIPAAYGHDLGAVIKPTRKVLLSGALWLLNLQQEYSYAGDLAVIDTGGKTRRYGADFSARYEMFKWLYFDIDVNYSHGRSTDQPDGMNFIALAPSFTSIGGVTVKMNKNLSSGLRYRHISDRPANDDNSLTALGYTVCDMVVNYCSKNYEFGAQVQNLFNVKWREAQFDTETRLRNPNGSLEPTTTSDVCYTPGTPFFLKLSATYRF